MAIPSGGHNTGLGSSSSTSPAQDLSTTPDWARSPTFSASPPVIAPGTTESDGMESWGYNEDDNYEENPFHDERLLEASPLHFLQQILVHDDNQRKQVVQRVTRVLKQVAQSTDPQPVITLLPLINHYAHEAPFRDIRDKFSELLSFLKELDLVVGRLGPMQPSAFVSELEMVSVDTSDREAQELLQGLFLTTGRISNVARVMLWHSSFARVYYSTYTTLLKGEGPLPLTWRSYIAMLAAARHGCSYLVRQQEEEFLLSGGPRSWLRGAEFAPVKIQNLLHFNALLAHQPWRLRRNHIEALVRGTDSWSMSELVHAITIMCTFHSLCGLVCGLGVVPEGSQTPLSQDSMPSPPVSGSGEAEDENTLFFERLQLAQAKVPDDPTERSKVFEHAEQQQGEIESGIETSGATVAMRQYVGDQYELMYRDFDVRSREYKVLRGQVYSWQDHVYSLMSQFYPGIPSLLQEEFTQVRTLTYNQFNTEENVDTQRLRNAIWHYVQRLYGIMYDDFSYGEVNLFLNIELKKYIKKVACFPESITYEDFYNTGYRLLPSEKCHVALITIEARKQVELMYGLHVINKILT